MISRRRKKHTRQSRSIHSPGEQQEQKETQDQQISSQPSPSISNNHVDKKSSKKSKKLKKSSSTLSFDLDNTKEDPSLKVNLSAADDSISFRSDYTTIHSKKGSGKSKRAKHKPMSKSSVHIASSREGEYTPEKLEQLKSETISWTSPSMDSSAGQEQPSNKVDDEHSKGKQEISPAGKLITETTSSTPASRLTTIPSEDMVQKAKAQRAQRREDGIENGEDFIPLSTPSSSSRFKSEDQTKRSEKSNIFKPTLPRTDSDEEMSEEYDAEEEDADDEEDMIGPKMSFGVPSEDQMKQTAKEEMKEMISGEKGPVTVVRDTKTGETETVNMDDDQQMDEEERKEIEEWEKSQLKKAGINVLDEREAAKQDLVETETDETVIFGRGHKLGKKPAIEAIETFDMVQRRLKNRLEQVSEEHKHTAQLLEHTETQCITTEEHVQRLDEEANNAIKQNKFFESLSEYVEVLLACLEAESPKIEELEDKLKQWRIDHGKEVLENWKESMDDEFEASEQGLGISIPGAQHPEVTDDEYGRDPTSIRRKTIQQRRSQRIERRRDRELEMQEEQGEESSIHPEGWSSDEDVDQSGSDQRYQDYIAKQAKKIFDDASEEYSNISNIRNYFDEWLEYYPHAFQRSYCIMSLPMIFAPFVRQELLEWNPLSDDRGDSFMEMNWFKQLADFGSDSDVAFIAEDGEELPKLIPELISKVVVPTAITVVQYLYCPLSYEQSSRLIDMVQDMLEYIEPESDEMKQLFYEIVERMQLYSSEIRIPHYQISMTDMENHTQPYEFMNRQFWKGIKLMKNIFLWEKILSPVTLQEIAISKLLRGKLIPLIASIQKTSNDDARFRAERIRDILPSSWSDGINFALSEIDL
eukprot:gb/GECH01002167.1/.p1 GENE.gb/GECH01002167.1/~~gb/GECH01002167.1/.p1  ORF type:complete len:868 (+),score=256.14 gb/GECH01002167.1/:1-2604(+)